MPTFLVGGPLAVQYEDLPEYPVASCTMMNGMASPGSDIRTRLVSATNWTPLFNGLTTALSAYGIEGNLAGRDVEPDYGIEDMLEAAAEWDIYNAGWIQYMQQFRELMDAAMASDLPSTQFGYWLLTRYGDYDETLALAPPDGACDFWKNKIENDSYPSLDLYEQGLMQGQGIVAGTAALIQAFQEDLEGAINLNNSIQRLYAENLALVAENEAAERAIQQSRFLHNVSQFSIVGAAVVLGADQLKLLK